MRVDEVGASPLTLLAKANTLRSYLYCSVVGGKIVFALTFGIAVRWRFVAALATAVVAEVALFTIPGLKHSHPFNISVIYIKSFKSEIKQNVRCCRSPYPNNSIRR